MWGSTSSRWPRHAPGRRQQARHSRRCRDRQGRPGRHFSRVERDDRRLRGCGRPSRYRLCPSGSCHAGDIFLGKRVPFLDAANGGSGVDIGDSVQRAHDTIRNIDTIITGHSTQQMTWSDLAEWAEFNRDFLEVVRSGHAAGRTVDEIATSWTMPAKYVGYDGSNVGGIRSNVQVIVDELEGRSAR